MRALTLTQPWATLMARGRKKVETRSWSTQHRGLVAIHAATTLPRSFRGLEDLFHAAGCIADPTGLYSGRQLPLGAVLAIGKLSDVWPIERAGQAYLWGLSETEIRYGDYSPGRFAWFFREVEPLDEPAPAKGALGLWEWRGVMP